MSPALETAGLTTVAMLCFAANSLLCRAALAGGHADAASFTALRIVGGAVALALLTRAQGSPRACGPNAWGTALALFAYAIGFSFAYLRLAAGVGALLLFAAVQFTMIGAGLLAGERPRLVEWTGLGLSLAGLVVLTRPGHARPDPAGALLMLGAGVAWGVYSLRGRRGAQAVAETAASFARAAPLALGACGVGALIGALRLDTVGALLALTSGALASGLGYAVWYAALRGLSATRAAIVQLGVPPLAAVGGVLVLGEGFSPRLVVSSLMIVGGIALAVTGQRPRASRAA